MSTQVKGEKQLFETDPVDAELKIKSIQAAPSNFFKLPERLEREEGEFVTVMTVSKRGEESEGRKKEKEE